MNQPLTNTQGKPTLDEQSFEQLLAAAFVLQEHNAVLRSTSPVNSPLRHAEIPMAETSASKASSRSKLASALKDQNVVTEAGNEPASHSRNQPVVGSLPSRKQLEGPQPRFAVEAEPISGSAKQAGDGEGGTVNCASCGNRMEAGEHFCGICGTARTTCEAGGDNLQNQLAAAWRMQQVPKKRLRTAPGQETAEPQLAGPASQTEKALESKAKSATNSSAPVELESAPQANLAAEEAREPEFTSAVESVLKALKEPAATAEAGNTAMVPLRIVPAAVEAVPEAIQPHPWASAQRALAWLESVKTTQRPRAVWLDRQWQKHRATFWLGTSALILLGVLLLSLFSDSGAYSAGSGSSAAANTASVSGRRRPLPGPKLTLFEKLLVNLGLAVPPEAPVYGGNPGTMVWLDLHTGLYYCPGADLYGKTPGGRFETQRDAQQDQFEPARRQACD